MFHLVTGGVRSGKSRYAQSIAEASQKKISIICTATAIDPEMACRIEKHRHHRPSHWHTIEEPFDIEKCVAIEAQRENRLIIIDCLGFWLNNHLHQSPKKEMTKDIERLIEQSSRAKDIVFVTNEIGLGVIPLGSLTRCYVDWLGIINQRMADAADRVTFMVSGIPVAVKGGGNPNNSPALSEC